MDEFAAIIEMRRRRQSGEQFGNFGFSIKGAIKSVTGAAKSVVSTVSGAASSIDPSYSGSIFGSGVAKVMKPVATWAVKPAVASIAASFTGGLSVVAGEKGIVKKDIFGIRPTATAAVEGAVIGGAILAAPALGVTGTAVATKVGAVATSIGTAVATQKIIQAASPSSSAGTSTAAPVGSTGQVGAAGTPDATKAALAGGAVGFVAGGPVGAIVGAIAGVFISRR